MAISALAATPALAQKYGNGNQGLQNGNQAMQYGQNYQNQNPNDQNAVGPLSQTMVQHLQDRLQQMGFYHGNIDGVWGPETQSAVRDFQQQRGLRPDGC